MPKKQPKTNSSALKPLIECSLKEFKEIYDNPDKSEFYFTVNLHGEVCKAPKALVHMPNDLIDNNIMRELLAKGGPLQTQDLHDATCIRFKIKETDLGHEKPNKKSPNARLTFTLEHTYSVGRLQKKGLIQCVSRHGDYAIYELTERVYDIIEDKVFYRRLVSGDLCNNIVNTLLSQLTFRKVG